ncbi:hypothetical protein BDQ12DRAFT_722880 [Crucibulum laeve]|uniref:Ser-Thr-rich glycosyl-phosphatidyl-inositol-anchored membrane family-domain-containing protein n=1 Tax=Crucibulum laeve TaxID=68775 RepID=A0A5C3M2R2_9AGAR|nr:hypothetical protein BDQ12DRAFT_722880 [Crucibulum laeve]
MLFLVIYSALAFAVASLAAPTTTLQSLIVFTPHITYPNKHDIFWHRGSSHNVTWETSKIPPEAINSTGMILLGHSGNNSENLDIDHPLATRFPINKGSVVVKIPADIEQRKDYFVVLFGDSGNKSPEFEIC